MVVSKSPIPGVVGPLPNGLNGLYVAFWGLHATYHLFGEPETTIEIRGICIFFFSWQNPTSRGARPGDECVEAYHETTGIEDVTKKPGGCDMNY